MSSNVLLDSRKRNLHDLFSTSQSTTVHASAASAADELKRRRVFLENSLTASRTASRTAAVSAASRASAVRAPAGSAKRLASVLEPDLAFDARAAVCVPKRNRVVPPAVPLPDDCDDECDDDDDAAAAELRINDVELDQPALAMVPYVQQSWQRAMCGAPSEREIELRLLPRLPELSAPFPRFRRASADDSSDNDADDEGGAVAAPDDGDLQIDELDDGSAAPHVTEPPSPWTLLPLGGHSANDGTNTFFQVLEHASRISVARVVPDNETPLDLLESFDRSSPTFAQACAFLAAHQHDFASLNLNFYDTGDATNTNTRQLVANHRNSTPLALWPCAAAVNNETHEVVVLVSQGARSQFPWRKVVHFFG
jgi:hypothetical protein